MTDREVKYSILKACFKKYNKINALRIPSVLMSNKGKISLLDSK